MYLSKLAISSMSVITHEEDHNKRIVFSIVAQLYPELPAFDRLYPDTQPNLIISCEKL